MAVSVCLVLYPETEATPPAREVNLAVLSDVLAEHQPSADPLLWKFVSTHKVSMALWLASLPAGACSITSAQPVSVVA